MDSSKVYCSWWYKSGKVLDKSNLINTCFNLSVDSHQSKIIRSKLVFAKKKYSTASHYYWRELERNYLSDITKDNSTSVTLPNSDTISSTKSGN